jgi:hypothetical protein
MSDYHGDGLSPSSLISADSFTFLVYPDSFHLVMQTIDMADRLVLAGDMMSTNASILVDSVGPPSAEVCRTATSFL